MRTAIADKRALSSETPWDSVARMFGRGLLLLLAVFAPMGSGQANKDSSLQRDLLAISNQFMVDWQKHDTAALGALMAPEFMYVASHGPVPRAGVVDGLMNHCTLASYKIGEPQMLQAGADSAVLIYSIHQDLTCFRQPESPDVQNTDTFVRRDGRWLLVMTTSTPLVKVPGNPA